MIYKHKLLPLQIYKIESKFSVHGRDHVSQFNWLSCVTAIIQISKLYIDWSIHVLVLFQSLKQRQGIPGWQNVIVKCGHPTIHEWVLVFHQVVFMKVWQNTIIKDVCTIGNTPLWPKSNRQLVKRCKDLLKVYEMLMKEDKRAPCDEKVDVLFRNSRTDTL